MAYFSRTTDRGMDWTLFSIYLAMLGIGWLMVYTVGYGDGYPERVFDLLSETIVGKQTIWIGMSLIIFFFTQVIDWKFWRTYAYLIYAFSILLLILVLFFGNTVKGATSWFSLGGFSFQPSEIAKFGTGLALASFLNNFNTNLKIRNHQLIAFGLMAFPMLLILLQPDAGSALIFLALLFMLYRAGLSAIYFFIGGGAGLLLILGLVLPPNIIFLGLILIGLLVLFEQFEKRKILSRTLVLSWLAGSVWLATSSYFDQVLLVNIILIAVLAVIHWLSKKERVVFILLVALIAGGSLSYTAHYVFNNLLKSHQQERINVWLQPSKCDPRGSLYNTLQSKMAIGSGGFEGKGFLKGTMTKLDFIPEQTTDFIFCTVGEEQGFIGTLVIIAIYLLLLYRITFIAERQRSGFSRYYAYGVAGIFFMHFFVNIGMTMGIMPVIGIPLPFISYGGSSLLGFTLLLGVLLKFDAHRSEP